MTLIEPPLTPTEPYSPNRVMIVLLGVLLAMGGAAGSAAVLNTLDSTVRGRNDLTALLAVPPLAVLPWIETQADRHAQLQTRHYTLAAGFAAVAAGLLLLHLFFRPLDVLWQMGVRWLAR
jgi:hypothetical protein